MKDSATVTFYGAAQEVTGSCHLIESGAQRFLVDCGIFQGNRLADDHNHAPFPFDPTTIDAIFVTHAHMDHIGRLPKLVAAGYRGPIYATTATRDFAEILFEDAAGIMAEEAERGGPLPLYQPEDIPRVLSRFVPVTYHEPVPLAGGFQAIFWDAGHILGSAIVELAGQGISLVFSGDLGNPPVPILARTESPDIATLVVMESTYGDRLHEAADEREKLLRLAITETVSRGGVLMIPSFALERTQEVLYYLHDLTENQAIPAVPVYLDSPLAIHATEIFSHNPDLMSQSAQHEWKAEDFLSFPSLHLTATREESREINGVPPPKVIIAGSGMMTGGRILHHAKRYLGDSNSLLLIIGYQAEGTIGRRLLSGAKRVRIHNEDIFVRARVRAIGAFSAHADQRQLLTWLKGIDRRPHEIALVHGELDRMRGLQAAITRELRIETVIPKLGQTITVPKVNN